MHNKRTEEVEEAVKVGLSGVNEVKNEKLRCWLLIPEVLPTRYRVTIRVQSSTSGTFC
jgi:hypothetical protein